MTKIGVLLTGGTPAVKETDKGRVSDSGRVFRDECLRIIEGKASVDIYETLNLDSSDFRGEHHEKLAEEIEKLVKAKTQYAGFILIHGTDTNAWTLASHSYMIKGLDIPMIHTGSILPNSHPRTDFPANFSGAFDGIFDNNLLGVYQYFGDFFLPGVKVTKQYTDTYKPFIDPHSNASFGVLDAKRKFQIDPYFRDRVNDAHRATSEVLDIDTKLEKEIDQIVLHPFFDYSYLDTIREKGKKGLHIQGYGDGNVPTDSDFINAVQRCIDSGMIVTLGSQCTHGRRHAAYEGGKKLLDMGAILMRDLTNEACLCKLAWALERYKGNPDKIRAALERDVNGDSVLL